MAKQPAGRLLTSPTSSHDWYYTCPFHYGCNSSHLMSKCLITDLGAAIRLGDVRDLHVLLHHGASPNQPCHTGTDSESDEFEFPLDLVTSRKYHYRSDAWFLALVAAGADPRLQAWTEKELRNLNDCLMVFATRPNAGLKTLEVALKLGVANTEWGRERLVKAVTSRCWYHGTESTGKEIWTPQDECLLAERQRIILENVSLSEGQKAQFWCDGSFSMCYKSQVGGAVFGCLQFERLQETAFLAGTLEGIVRVRCENRSMLPWSIVEAAIDLVQVLAPSRHLE